MEMVPQLLNLRNEENVRKNVPSFVQQRRKLTDDLCPKIQETFVYQDQTDDSIIKVRDNFQRFRNNPRFKKLYEEVHIKVKSQTSPLTMLDTILGCKIVFELHYFFSI